MTDEHIKEQLSRKYIEIIASRMRCIIEDGNIDIGVDLILHYVKTTTFKGRKTYDPTGQRLDIQLKSTTTKSVVETSDFLKFDLEVKNFNQLIRRSHTRVKSERTNPLILTLFILPENPSKWVEVKENKLILRKAAYWFEPLKNTLLSSNVRTVRITIPKINKIDLNDSRGIAPTFFC